MLRAQQAGLPDGSHRVGRQFHGGSYEDFNVGMPVFDRHLADAADHDVVDHHR